MKDNSDILNGKFKLNSFNGTDILDKWNKSDKSKKIITIEDIEIEYDNSSDITLLTEFFLNINKINNKVQDFCRSTYLDGNTDAKYYIVSLSWIDLENNIITLGYWGDYCNIELRALCELKDNQLQLTDICYQ